MEPVKNIIFDLGGIFLNIDYQLTSKAFKRLGVHQFDEMFTQQYSNDLFELLETGRLSPQDFYNAFRKEAGLELTDDQIRDAWNALLLDFPAERIQWLESIRNKYNIYLFSNTNQIHYDQFMADFTRAYPGKDFNGYFIHAYYSQTLGLRKPYMASFQQILKEQGLDPAETLFIDDTFKNIQGAQQVGLRTIHLEAPKTVLDLDL
ncbi:MAG: HAD family phosphatase [Sediminibacterium sp.]|nr:HAD family phosphatase [Sediminibacterium sp.]